MRPARHLLASVSTLVLAAALGSAGLAVSPARAESAPDAAELFAMAKALQSRVTALETENRQAKQEAAAARAEARDLRKKLTAAPSRAAAAPTIPAVAGTAASQSYAMATKAPFAPPVPAWGGFYAGAAFGLASLHSDVGETSTSTSTTTDTAVPPVFTDVFTSANTFAGNLSGRNIGAIVNLHLGYNYMVSDKVILGGQVEGGVSNIRVNLSGTGVSTSTNTAVITPPGGLAGTSSSVSVTNETLADQIDNRWMVSVLARGGVLVDPVDFLYGIGGWTYGRFEFGPSFGLNGGTIGAGWERQLAPGWTFRTEGRYTKFQSRTLTSSSASSSTSNQFNGAGVLTETVANSNANLSNDRVSADMWSVWFGVSHYFN